MFISKNENKKLLISSIILSILFCFLFLNLYQQSLDMALIISRKVIYPEDFSIMKHVYLKSFSITNFISAVLLILTDSLHFSSIVIIFLYAFILTYGLSLIIFSFSKSLFFTIIFVLIQILFKINLGSGDYYVSFISQQNWGTIASAFFIFILGLFFLKNYYYLGFFIIFFLIIHPVIAAWVLLNLVFAFICYRFFYVNKFSYYQKKIFFKGIIAGLLFVIFYYFFYYILINSLFNIEAVEGYDLVIMKKYLTDWDVHRSKQIIYFSLLFLLVFTNILSFFYLKFLTIREKFFNPKNFIILFISILNISSILLFFVERFFIKESDFVFLNSLMLSRFLILTSIIGVFLLVFLISQFILYFYKNNYFLKKNSNFFSVIFVLLLILIIQPKQTIHYFKHSLLMNYSTFHSSNLTSGLIKDRWREPTLKLIRESFKDEDDDFFWKEFKKIKTEGVFVTTNETTYPTLRLSNKPILMDNNSIDFLPYHPKLARDYLNIIQNVFGIDFFNLNEKYKRKGFISDDLIEEHFQKLTVQDWIFLKNKYSLAGVVLPNNWKINLKKTLSGKKYSVYLI
jgi:hypothetical protein